MSIRIITLKSGEDIIADVQEMVQKIQTGPADENGDAPTTDQVVAVKLIKPFIVKITEPSVLLEEDRKGLSVLYYPWAPLSKDKEFFIGTDWIVTHYEAHEDIVNSYLEKRDGRGDDRHDGSVGGGASDEGSEVLLTEESSLDDIDD